jgi:MFS family permease
VIEWYDFYIFGSLAAIVSPKFYPAGNEALALIAYLSTFAVGFVVRPFGAIFFGRIGDLVGRKYAFLVTRLIMGLGDGGGGVHADLRDDRVPGAGPAAAHPDPAGPGARRGIRRRRHLRGRARAGREAGLPHQLHPDHRHPRPVPVADRDPQRAADHGGRGLRRLGWRIPFLLSIVLVATSLYIRLRMRESPIFSTLKSRGQTSRTPTRDALGNKENWRVMLRSLFGATVGQGVVWYTGQFYALFYLQSILKLEPKTANIAIAVALLLAMPLFVVFGNLSDRIGRKRIMMAGCIVAALTYYPIYRAMVWAAGNGVASVEYSTGVASTDISLRPLDAAGVEVTGAPDANLVALVALVFIQVVFVTMVYGPIAAYLVEAFPARIRYTSLSLPYHIGNGVFGGLLPVIGLILCAVTGNIYAGLSYPIFFALLTFVVGTKLLPETRHVRIWDERGQTASAGPRRGGRGGGTLADIGTLTRVVG